MDLFLVKKIISQLLMPIPLVLLLLLCALFSSGKKSKLALLTGLLILGGLSSHSVSYWLVDNLEKQVFTHNLKQDISENNPCVILVLGSGMEEFVPLSSVQQLSATGAMRLLAGVEFYQQQLKQGKQCLFVTSGGIDGINRQPYALVAKHAAIDLGVREQDILMLDQARDTGEEVQALKQLLVELGAEKVTQQGSNILDSEPVYLYLVSSATHLPRAAMIFEQQQVPVYLIPADIQARRHLWWRLTADNLLNSQQAIHEYVGLLWYRIKFLIL